MIPAFYPLVDTGCGLPATDAAEAILEAGARILQFRHKGFFSRDVFEEAKRIAALSRDAGALFVINDRADIALLLDAALHLGQDDLPPADARRIMPPGRSIGFDSFLEQGYTLASRSAAGWRGTFPSFLPVYDIDHVWLRPGLRLRSCTVFTGAASDHRGQFVSVLLKSPEATADDRGRSQNTGL